MIKEFIFPRNQDEESSADYTGKAIFMFRGDYEFLSNMYPCKVSFDKMDFNSVEQAYMASKTIDLEVRKSIAEMSPREAKKFSRTADFPLREDFNEAFKLGIMKLLVEEKFSNKNPQLRQKLLSTDNASLVEGNYWDDDYWGFDLKAGMGQNNLGKILMYVRDELRIAKGSEPVAEKSSIWVKNNIKTLSL